MCPSRVHEMADRGARPLRRTARAQRASPATGTGTGTDTSTRDKAQAAPSFESCRLQVHSFLRARSGCRSVCVRWTGAETKRKRETRKKKQSSTNHSKRQRTEAGCRPCSAVRAAYQRGRSSYKNQLLAGSIRLFLPGLSIVVFALDPIAFPASPPASPIAPASSPGRFLPQLWPGFQLEIRQRAFCHC